MNRGGYRGEGATPGRGFRGGGRGGTQGQQIGGPSYMVFGNAASGGAQRLDQDHVDPRLRRGPPQGQVAPPTPTWGGHNVSTGMHSGLQQQRAGYGHVYESGRPMVSDRKPPTSLMQVDTQHGDPSADRSPNPLYMPRCKSVSSLSACSSASEEKPKPMPPNQCEIVYDPRTERVEAYAYRILTSIKSLGLTTDLLFPRSGLSIAEIMRGLNKRGTTFVILINDANVGRESFTLNILRPVELRAEHRNITHEEGLKKMREVMETITKREEVTVVPENVKACFRSMVQGKFLSDSDFQKCIKYISSRWERQRVYQGKTDFEPGLGIYTDDQLREKILEILDGDGTEGEGEVGAGAAPTAAAPEVSLRRKISEELHEIAGSRKKPRLMAAASSTSPNVVQEETKTPTPPPPPVIKPAPAAAPPLPMIRPAPAAAADHDRHGHIVLSDDDGRSARSEEPVGRVRGKNGDAGSNGSKIEEIVLD